MPWAHQVRWARGRVGKHVSGVGTVFGANTRADAVGGIHGHCVVGAVRVFVVDHHEWQLKLVGALFFHWHTQETGGVANNPGDPLGAG